MLTRESANAIAIVCLIMVIVFLPWAIYEAFFRR